MGILQLTAAHPEITVIPKVHVLQYKIRLSAVVDSSTSHIVYGGTITS
jgi:hypothetical protein